jgi:hypothetical protein
MGKSVQQMQFTLTGFTQDEGCRVFAYEGTGDDRVRTKFTVRADLALSRKYGIRLQELPLMCLAILERNSESGAADTAEPVNIQRAITFTEDAMIQYADECVAARDAAALKRTSMRRQPAKAAAAVATGEFNPYSEIAPAPAKPYGQNW